MKFLKLCFIIFFISILSFNVSSSSVRSLSLSQLVEISDLIIEGVVVGQNTFWWNNKIVTSNYVQISNKLKGSNNEQYVEVITLGGEIDGVGMLIPGEVRLEDGSKYIFFLQNRENFYVSSSMAQAVFSVRNDTDEERVYPLENTPNLINDNGSVINRLPMNKVELMNEINTLVQRGTQNQ